MKDVVLGVVQKRVHHHKFMLLFCICCGVVSCEGFYFLFARGVVEPEKEKKMSLFADYVAF